MFSTGSSAINHDDWRILSNLYHKQTLVTWESNSFLQPCHKSPFTPLSSSLAAISKRWIIIFCHWDETIGVPECLPGVHTWEDLCGNLRLIYKYFLKICYFWHVAEICLRYFKANLLPIIFLFTYSHYPCLQCLTELFYSLWELEIL